MKRIVLERKCVPPLQFRPDAINAPIGAVTTAMLFGEPETTYLKGIRLPNGKLAIQKVERTSLEQ